MIYKTIFIAFLILVIISCDYKNISRVTILKDSDGTKSEGVIFSDSAWNGKVKYYDSSDNYLGYSTFKYGVKEGTEVSFYKNRKISDSSFYHNDMMNGFAYKFDETGKIKFKTFYLNDRNFGHVYRFDSKGNIENYYFINFEGKIIFESMKKDSVIYHKGEFINANIYTSLRGDKEKDFLFLYLILSPYNKSHYEIAILNNKKQIISSQIISSTNCYYEQEIPVLTDGNLYAIVLHTFNSYKGKDDLLIRIIE